MTDRLAPSCEELVELVTEYLEDVLTPAERDAFERHVGRCGDCSRYLDQMRQTIAALGDLQGDELSPTRRARLVASFKAWVADR